MCRCSVQLAVCMLSIMVHGLVANAAWALIIREDDVLGVLIRVEGDVFNLDGPWSGACIHRRHGSGGSQYQTARRTD